MGCGAQTKGRTTMIYMVDPTSPLDVTTVCLATDCPRMVVASFERGGVGQGVRAGPGRVRQAGLSVPSCAHEASSPLHGTQQGVWHQRRPQSAQGRSEGHTTHAPAPRCEAVHTSFYAPRYMGGVRGAGKDTAASAATARGQGQCCWRARQLAGRERTAAQVPRGISLNKGSF